ncbi:hypothetical protein HOLDEFILI_01949 [Holdemania filiformis DSM 12042]|uniref:Uncharacterized protein n=1 Tax=Holdemania filiformis DSM 12042 TaxID=545696 RepID=B9Y803_9FIRM|nr:hypothetical protein HOLDEFILI_01949 [Holdemania filiformis DSM 12042]
MKKILFVVYEDLLEFPTIFTIFSAIYIFIEQKYSNKLNKKIEI